MTLLDWLYKNGPEITAVVNWKYNNIYLFLFIKNEQQGATCPDVFISQSSGQTTGNREQVQVAGCKEGVAAD